MGYHPEKGSAFIISSTSNSFIHGSVLQRAIAARAQGKRQSFFLRGFMASLSWVLVIIPVDAMCGFDSLNTYGNHVLGELKCVFVVDVV